MAQHGVDVTCRGRCPEMNSHKQNGVDTRSVLAPTLAVSVGLRSRRDGSRSTIGAAQARIQKSKSINRLTDLLAGTPTNIQKERIRSSLENSLIRDITSRAPTDEFDPFRDVLPHVRSGLQSMVQDNFSNCFKRNLPDPWNWNVYLYTLWCLGVVFRYGFLFPLRLLVLLLGSIFFLIGFGINQKFVKSEKTRHANLRWLVRFLASTFVLSWTGVIKYHGVIPKRKPNQIYVANHSSMVHGKMFCSKPDVQLSLA